MPIFFKQQMGTSWFSFIARFDVQDLNLIALFAAFSTILFGGSNLSFAAWLFAALR